MRTVFLLTDFGSGDTYCGQMKASFLSRAPDTSFVDLTCSIPPGDVRAGAFHLMVAAPWIPPGSGVLAVVDPGVGTARRAVLAACRGSLYCGPDNGLLGWIDASEAWLLPQPGEGASSTFHGRDLFAPVLAAAMEDAGAIRSILLEAIPVASMARLPRPVAVVEGDSILTEVACVDSFGNCILWLTAAELGDRIPVSADTARGKIPLSIARTYDSGGLLLVEGSSGHLELAVARGSAAALTGLSAGDRLSLSSEVSSR